MRSLIFFLVIFAMLGGGIYLVAQKMDIDLGFSSGKISPKNEWRDQLVGSWKFKTRISNPTELWVFDGKVEYLADGNYVRQVTIKYYQHYDRRTPEEKEHDLRIVAGGTIKGRWVVDSIDGNWKEITESCELANSIVKNGYNQDYDGCYWFVSDDTSVYGDYTTPFKQSETKVFSKDKIVIEGKNFSDSGTMEWTYKRMN